VFDTWLPRCLFNRPSIHEIVATGNRRDSKNYRTEHVERMESGLCLLPGSPGTASGDPAVMTINQVAQAYRAALDEHKMPILEAARTYKEALGWSAVMATVRLWAIDCLFSIPYLSVARLRIVPSHLPLTRPADSRHASFRYQPAHLILRPARLPEAIWLCNYWGSRAVSAQARVAVRYL